MPASLTLYRSVLPVHSYESGVYVLKMQHYYYFALAVIMKALKCKPSV